MTDPELVQVRAPELLTVTVVRARDLRGQRGEQVNALVKVEFGEKVLGESPKVMCSVEEAAEFNFNTSINVTFEDPATLDELACKPVVMTIIEVLPKEKKQKEEKTVMLGQVAVDLFPLVQGESKHKYTLPIIPLPGSPLETLPADHPKPELDVQISVGDALLTEPQLKECNLMSVTMESVFSTPEAFTLTGPQFLYTAALPVPIAAEKENTVVFAGGMPKPGADKEVPNKQKKWAMPGNAQGNAVYIPDVELPSDSYEDEDGDFRSKDDREHRITSEQDKNRVTWNIERRCYLDVHATKSFQDKIAKMRYWPVEIYRTPMPPVGGKAPPKKEDENHISYHGVAFVNLSPLLYPGVKRIRGCYKVEAYSDAAMAEKTQRKGGLADEAHRIANGILSRTASSPFPKPVKGSKEETKSKDPKKGGSSLKASDAASDTDGQGQVNVEGLQYVEARSYVMLEIGLQRPLVPKRPPEELAKKVAAYIPPRPLFPKRTDGAERAVGDFHNNIANVASMILDEFRDNFGDIINSGDAKPNSDIMESRRQQLIYQLNSSGKYFAFKEQLKHCVVKIVREKYLKTTSFKDNDELQAFLSELYVYLVDQMHVALGKTFSVEDQSPIPAPLTDSAQLKHFAREAEVNGNFELAAKYYQERIARDRNDPDHWLEYGTFCLYINDLTKAEECFKECVSVDQRHINGLLLYGVVCTMQDKNEAAETFFEAATCVDPKSALVWTMLGLFYDGVGNEIGCEMALLEAHKLNLASAAAEALRLHEEEERQNEVERGQETEREKQEQDVFQQDVRPPEEVAGQEAVPGKGEDGVEGGVSIKQIPATPTSLTGSDSKKNIPTKADRRNSAARKSATGNKGRSMDNIAGSRPGSTHARSPTGRHGSIVDPVDESETKPRIPTPVPTQTIFMQAVEFLLDVKAMPFTERALSHHLLEPLGGPSADYYIALARLKLQKQSFAEAENSLKEALQFDHQNPDAWAIMGHVKYLVGEADVAKDCYERTLAFYGNASEMHSIYLRLASLYLQEGRFEEAKRHFLMACKRSPSCVSWLGVGIACFRLGELSEAEDALAEANVLNNSDPEVWAYLSFVCLRTGRQLEAEQAYKYAIKLNLQDEDLINELHQVQEEVGFGNPQL